MLATQLMNPKLGVGKQARVRKLIADTMLGSSVEWCKPVFQPAKCTGQTRLLQQHIRCWVVHAHCCQQHISLRCFVDLQHCMKLLSVSDGIYDVDMTPNDSVSVLVPYKAPSDIARAQKEPCQVSWQLAACCPVLVTTKVGI